MGAQGSLNIKLHTAWSAVTKLDVAREWHKTSGLGVTPNTHINGAREWQDANGQTVTANTYYHIWIYKSRHKTNFSKCFQSRISRLKCPKDGSKAG